jgi:hypothetical protein
LSETGEARLGRVADVMIPQADGFPEASRIVPEFVSDRIDPQERDTLDQLLAAVEDDSDDGLTSWLRALEADDNVSFVLIRNWVYYGYYASQSVAEALRLSGSDYHGAPQPFGYRIDEEAPIPANPRGAYVTTEEVKNVLS